MTSPTEASGTSATSKKTKHPTYRQDWPAYHAAQTHEKAHFQALLYDLWEANQRTCSELGMPP